MQCPATTEDEQKLEYNRTMKETTEEFEAEQKPTLMERMMKSRAVRSFIAGTVITLLSWVILGFNLSTGGSIKINDDVNRYFDTCVLETFVESTPRIRTDERGFPLAFYQRNHVPVCNEPGIEARRNTSTVIDWGSLGANVLFWTCLVFWITRKYTLRKQLKITRNA